MGKRWISVLMPLYNGATYLRSALDSVVAEADHDIEVIAVDDASADATPEILEEYRDRLNLIVYRNEQNRGWTASTNQAMGLARGLYQCWLHQDDLWERGRLSVLKKYAERYPQATLFLHPVQFVDSRGRHVGRWRCSLPPDRPLEPKFVTARLLVQNFTAAPAPLYRSEVVDAVGNLDERLWYTGDWDFWLRVANSGTTVYCPEFLAGYRIHAESLTVRRGGDFEELRRQYDAILTRHLGEAANGEWRSVARAARFSAFVNCEFARRLGGGRVRFSKLASELLRLRPADWRRYFRDSRIHERVLSRARIGALSKAAWRSSAPHASEHAVIMDNDHPPVPRSDTAPAGSSSFAREPS